MESIVIGNFGFTYNGSEKPALKDINLKINKGDFHLIIGESGSGKSTLIKLLKPEIVESGSTTGEIINGIVKNSVADVAYVGSNPDAGIITDKVWHELSFTLENMGTESGEIKRRVAETASYFGISSWYEYETDSLSGGEKQLLNLASALTAKPKILLLDEPTSMLDPISAERFINMVAKLNNDIGITVIAVTHNLEKILPFANGITALSAGKVVATGETDTVIEALKTENISRAFPTSVRLYQKYKKANKIPKTVKEGTDYLEKIANGKTENITPNSPIPQNTNVALSVKDLTFKYSKYGRTVLNNLNLTVYKGETFFVCGGNGSGKSTLLSLIVKNLPVVSGKITVNGKKINRYEKEEYLGKIVALLPQNPLLTFTKDTVKEEIGQTENALTLAKRFNISHLLNKHPYDISGGEQQKCALIKLLVKNPEIILLDEPTKGLDVFAKSELINIIKELKSNGKTVISVTHDLDFAAQIGGRTAMLMGGDIISATETHTFLKSNRLFTTSASLITENLSNYAVTFEETVSFLGEEENE